MKQLLTIISLFVYLQSNAQLFGTKDLSIQLGYLNFHAKSLNNSANSNYKISRVTELDKNIKIRRMASLNTGFGIGILQNLDNRFTENQSSKFYRIKVGLVFHSGQHITPNNWSPKRVNPYVKIAYNIDLFDKTYSTVNGSALGSSLRLGFGAVIKLSHRFGLVYEFSHNQRITQDYRTYYQQNIGLVLNMDQSLLKR